MPIPTPFHARTEAVCDSNEWRTWSGYKAASLYEPSHEREYFAIRNSAALIDISPLFKYEISGPDAVAAVDRIMTRNIAKCRVGQVMYSPWCDGAGKIIDDGTISRLDENFFRITAADPMLRWFQDVSFGFDVEVVDVSTDLAALALQGPCSRDILKEAVDDVDFDSLKFFYLANGRVDGFPLTITRTGYTGDLGYELWVAPEHAEALWDRLMAVGSRYGLLPAGMLALDMARIEAGLLLIEVDYTSTNHAVIEPQKSSPFEIGLGWTVDFDGGDYIGRKALLAEKKSEPDTCFVGIEINWPDLERVFDEVDLPPQVASRASRESTPIYKNGRQIGKMTSSSFSPILKKYVGIGTIKTEYARIGTDVEVEFTVEYAHKNVAAAIVKTPFYNPKRKRE